jgi:cation diffusion facilitator family transporter
MVSEVKETVPPPAAGLGEAALGDASRASMGSSRSLGTDRDDAVKEGVLTVVLAGTANLATAVAKIVAGVLGGSVAMQAEAAHSVADTVTEVFLFVAARRGGRDPDARHPLGHGRETYLWAFLAAVTTFVLGAGFSLARGVEILHRGESSDAAPAAVPFIVLIFAFLMETLSLRRGLTQARAGAEKAGLRRRSYLRLTSDTTLKAVILEDSAALIGLVIAFGGLGLWHLTGNAAWDGVASILIGLLLVIVAVSLAATNLSLLTGQAASEPLQSALRSEVDSLAGVEAVHVFVAVVLGPGNLLVAAKVHFAADSSATDIERTADEAEERLRARFPGVRYVFLDPTRAGGTHPGFPGSGQ